MDKPIGFSVIGLGMGRSRARTVTQTEGAKLVAVCDIREELARQVAEQLQCDWTTDFCALLQRDDIDVVDVMVPSGLHGDFAIQAMKAGKHVIVTKPMDVSLGKADAMIATAQETGRLLAVDFEARYQKSWQQMKAAIDGGLLGKLILGEGRLKWYRSQDYYAKSGWRGTWAMDGGGSLANQTIHFIDLLQWLMGEVEEVMAGYYGVFAHEIETEDLGMAMLKFRNGAVGTILGTTTFPADAYAGLEIHGDKGGVITLWGEKPKWFFLNKEQQPPDVTPSVRNVIEEVVRALREGTPVAVDGREGRKSLEILIAIYQSARERRPVRLSEMRR